MSEDRSTEEAGEPTNTPESFEKQQETIAALQEQLAQANERDRENRRIIAAFTQRIPAIEAPEAPGPSATPTDAGEGPQTPTEATDEQQGRGPIPDAGGPQEPAQPRSWWQRMFGG